MKTVRVSLPGTNALEENPDPRNYALLADDDNILIKEHSRGSVPNTDVVEHNIGYFPHFYAYGEVSSGLFQIASGYNLVGEFTSSVDENNLYLTNNSGSAREMRYFLFYDDIPE